MGTRPASRCQEDGESARFVGRPASAAGRHVVRPKEPAVQSSAVFANLELEHDTAHALRRSPGTEKVKEIEYGRTGISSGQSKSDCFLYGARLRGHGFPPQPGVGSVFFRDSSGLHPFRVALAHVSSTNGDP